MKQQKIKLITLEVKSFIIQKEGMDLVKGGDTDAPPLHLPSDNVICKTLPPNKSCGCGGGPSASAYPRECTVFTCIPH